MYSKVEKVIYVDTKRWLDCLHDLILCFFFISCFQILRSFCKILLNMDNFQIFAFTDLPKLQTSNKNKLEVCLYKVSIPHSRWYFLSIWCPFSTNARALIHVNFFSLEKSEQICSRWSAHKSMAIYQILRCNLGSI